MLGRLGRRDGSRCLNLERVGRGAGWGIDCGFGSVFARWVVRVDVRTVLVGGGCGCRSGISPVLGI
jgi:hypothetical protein